MSEGSKPAEATNPAVPTPAPTQGKPDSTDQALRTPQTEIKSPEPTPAKAPDLSPAEPAKAPDQKGNPTEAEKPADGEKPAIEEIVLTLPKDSLLDDAARERIASYAKEQGLSKEQAQSLLERESQSVSSFWERQKAAFETRKEGWRKAAETDQEIGGQEFGKNVELAHRAVKRFGSDAFLKELEQTGYGNHPELVRVFARIGKAMSNDELVHAKAPAGQRPVEDIFYGNSNKEK